MSSNSWLRILATAPIVSAFLGREAEPPSDADRRPVPARPVSPSPACVAIAIVSAPGS